MRRFFSIFGRQAFVATAFVLGTVIGSMVLFATGCGDDAEATGETVQLIIGETLVVYYAGAYAQPIDGSSYCELKRGGKITIVAVREADVLVKYVNPKPAGASESESADYCKSESFVVESLYDIERLKLINLSNQEEARLLEFFRQEAEKYNKAHPQAPSKDLPAESPNQP